MTISEAEYDHMVGKIEEMEAREADHLALRKEMAAKIEHQAAEIEKLRGFKDYVHGRLDRAGVPTHPDGLHSKAGCRIGDRLDLVDRRIGHQVAEIARLHEVIRTTRTEADPRIGHQIAEIARLHEVIRTARTEADPRVEHQAAEIGRLRDLIRTARVSAEIGLERQNITHARLNLEAVSRVLWEALHGGGEA